MTDDQNRKIAEWFGIPWHTMTPHEHIISVQQCSCGKSVYLHKLREHLLLNPDFSHRDAFWLIIENGPKREWWTRFVCQDDEVFFFFTIRGKITSWAIRQHYVGVCLAEELLKFIEKEEGK